MDPDRIEVPALPGIRQGRSDMAICISSNNGRQDSGFPKLRAPRRRARLHDARRKGQVEQNPSRALLKVLHGKGLFLTNMSYGVALPIIGAAAAFEDEINAQMGTGRTQMCSPQVRPNDEGSATQKWGLAGVWG